MKVKKETITHHYSSINLYRIIVGGSQIYFHLLEINSCLPYSNKLLSRTASICSLQYCLVYTS